MATIGLLINPYARRNRHDQARVDAMIKAVGENGRCIVTRSLDEIDNAAKELAEGGFDCLGVSGGDGSASHFISSLRRQGYKIPPFLFVPSGTTNMVQITLKQSKNGPKLLEKVVHNPIQAIKREKRDLLNIDNTHYGFVFGIGLVTKFLEIYYDGPGRGVKKTLYLLRKIVLSTAKRSHFARDLVTPVRAVISVDGRELPMTEYTAVLVQTYDNLSSGFRPMYRAFEKEGTFHCLATSLSAPGLVNRLPLIYRGQPWNHPKVDDSVGKKMVITFPESGMYQVDGDIYPCGKTITCTAEDDPVELLVP